MLPIVSCGAMGARSLMGVPSLCKQRLQKWLMMHQGPSSAVLRLQLGLVDSEEIPRTVSDWCLGRSQISYLACPLMALDDICRP